MSKDKDYNLIFDEFDVIYARTWFNRNRTLSEAIKELYALNKILKDLVQVNKDDIDILKKGNDERFLVLDKNIKRLSDLINSYYQDFNSFKKKVDELETDFIAISQHVNTVIENYKELIDKINNTVNKNTEQIQNNSKDIIDIKNKIDIDRINAILTEFENLKKNIDIILNNIKQSLLKLINKNKDDIENNTKLINDFKGDVDKYNKNFKKELDSKLHDIDDIIEIGFDNTKNMIKEVETISKEYTRTVADGINKNLKEDFETLSYEIQDVDGKQQFNYKALQSDLKEFKEATNDAINFETNQRKDADKALHNLIDRNITNIENNKNAIGSNKTDIESNKDLIVKNKNNIDINKKILDKNTINIERNKSNIDSNKKIIDNNKNLIDINKNNIDKNTKSINTNKENIDKNTLGVNTNQINILINKAKIDEVRNDLKENFYLYPYHILTPQTIDIGKYNGFEDLIIDLTDINLIKIHMPTGINATSFYSITQNDTQGIGSFVGGTLLANDKKLIIAAPRSINGSVYAHGSFQCNIKNVWRVYDFYTNFDYYTPGKIAFEIGIKNILNQPHINNHKK